MSYVVIDNNSTVINGVELLSIYEVNDYINNEIKENGLEWRVNALVKVYGKEPFEVVHKKTKEKIKNL